MKNLSIIYDVTARCNWNCNICCMGASSDKAKCKNELSCDEKLDVAEKIAELQKHGYNVKVDLSGGEIFTNIEDHKKLIKSLSEKIGKEKLGISCSGSYINDELAKFLGEYVHDVEMTMDTVPYKSYKLRPVGYNNTAANAVSRLKEAGCKVGLQTVVNHYNNSYEDAYALFGWCCANNVDDWSILRFFASGRGAAFPEAQMNDEECEKYVRMVLDIEKNYKGTVKPEVDFHYLMPGHKKYTHECRCVRKSIGILPNGDVVACFWALDSTTGIVDPKFLLGNVRKQSLVDILSSEKAVYWTSCVHGCELAA